MVRSIVVTSTPNPKRSITATPSAGTPFRGAEPRGGLMNRQVNPTASNVPGSPRAMICTSYPSE